MCCGNSGSTDISRDCTIADTRIAIIQIPARPFLAPVFDKYAQPEQVSRRFLERVAAQLSGDFGRP